MTINRKQAVLIMLVSLVAVFSLTELTRFTLHAEAGQPPQPTLRQRWEYCTVNMVTPGSGGWKAQVSRGGSTENVESDLTGITTLNRLGLEGWELVNVVHEKGNSAEYFLKRPMR